MASYRDLLDRRPDLDSKIAKVLYGMYLDEDVPIEETLGEMASFWDGIDLARDGVFDLETERRKLRAFLERWSRQD